MSGGSVRPGAGRSRMLCGIQPVREAIRAHGAKLERVLVEATSSAASPQLEALARFAHDQGAHVERLARSELDRLARGVRHQGAIAFAPELALSSLVDLVLDDTAIVIALDEVQDPQNFGAVIRSAVAMGATAVLWPEHRSAPLSPATFRASAGAIEHATLCRVPSLPPALEALQHRGLAVVGLDIDGDSPLDRIHLARPVVLVVGAEDKGLRKTVKRVCDVRARLPMPGPIGSLNASVAVAIALYEVVRQRGARSGGAAECA
ncbi:MAG: 23S rRNA (guanosine(2251)-2'-O)-methyltransferase RlmB [Myxococcota bacterium]|nr:23S rRNA (guanosine(2251)-2'-O)-methyltransferase RlmB [Myxococcota bacterium]